MSLAILVAGLGYGDEGKGQTVADLAARFDAKMIVRYNGGAQAGHNVMTLDGRHHTFSQFGSASFIPNMRTHLSQFMVVSPVALINEVTHLARVARVPAEILLSRLTIDGRALVTTPFHREVNRRFETGRGAARHGSCGMGIGECRADSLADPEGVLRMDDLKHDGHLRDKLQYARKHQRDKLMDWGSSEVLTDDDFFERVWRTYVEIGKRVIITNPSFLGLWLGTGKPNVIFEGAQGALLDETYGFAPYHTWSDCTFNNAYAILNEMNFCGQISRRGVLRAYHTRHGAGPFVTEDEFLTQGLRDPYNLDTLWQGAFRVGYFDMVAAKYALKVIGGVDKIHLTCYAPLADLLPAKLVCMSYKTQYKGPYLTDQGQLHFYAKPAPSLNFQMALAASLFQTQPHETEVLDGDANQYAQFLQRELATEILLEEEPVYA